MKKLALDIEALAVDTFVPDAGEQDKDGTVHGNDAPTYTSCNNSTRVGNCFCTECDSCFCQYE